MNNQPPPYNSGGLKYYIFTTIYTFLYTILSNYVTIYTYIFVIIGGFVVKDNELILILDFYGQYNQLIARRVRECNVYCEIVPYDISIEKIKEKNPKGIIFTGRTI